MKTSIVWLCVRLLPLALLAAAPAAAQVPENCPHVCNQTYALCIAASCDPETGECGQCNATDGSCGYCYVFEGESCSYNAPCDQVAPSGDTVYSTYSEVLAAQYGFQVLACSSPTHTADCMDGKCTLTGKTVMLTDKNGQQQEIPTAICECVISTGGPPRTLGGQCNEQNCSAVWSTAGSVLDSQPACAEAEGTQGR